MSDGKKTFEVIVNGSVKHVFHNKYARQAALKAATKGYTNIHLRERGTRERGTDKVHMFKGSVSRKPAPAGARAAKDGMINVPKVKKIGTERLTPKTKKTPAKKTSSPKTKKTPTPKTKKTPAKKTSSPKTKKTPTKKPKYEFAFAKLLLKRCMALIDKYNEEMEKYVWGDEFDTARPDPPVPKGAFLTMKQAALIAAKKIPGLWVAEPPYYDKASYLNSSHEMFDGNISRDQVGNFYEVEGDDVYPRAAVSGSGGDLWWIVNDKLVDWLLGIILKLESNLALKKKGILSHKS